MTKSIFETLKRLHLTSSETRVIFNRGTRDVPELNVWRDTNSGVIYIDDFYTGTETYVNGSYRDGKSVNLKIGHADFERVSDAERRFNSTLKFIAGKNVADFGCGSGNFLKRISPYCPSVLGIELQNNYVEALNADGIKCVTSLEEIEDASLDVIVSFHVLEHLPNPLETLQSLKAKVVSGGMMVIEVPHAKDFLISALSCNEFKQFTLWSQHLILHTRESLRRTLDYVGLADIQIVGVQRYSLSNHLTWLSKGKAGGHKSPLSILESDALAEAYCNSLARIDATDTLMAIAKVP
jgi:2-polyprenyl-3-methyl-5-hydroxy-6-metoxy-1,4-benzoquinol methylase